MCIKVSTPGEGDRGGEADSRLLLASVAFFDLRSPSEGGGEGGQKILVPIITYIFP
jgi:hypothetical protein